MMLATNSTPPASSFIRRRRNSFTPGSRVLSRVLSSVAVRLAMAIFTGGSPSEHASSQYLRHSFERLGQRRIIMDERHPEEAVAGIAAVGIGHADIAARQGLDRGFLPQAPGSRLAVADLQPQEETALGPIETVAAAQDPFGDVDLRAVERAVGLDVALVAPECRGAGLDRHRHLRGAEAAE